MYKLQPSLSPILSIPSSQLTPTSIWVTSDASAYKLRIGAGGTWFDPPGLIGHKAFVVNRNEEIQVKHTAGSSSDTNYQTTVNVGYGTGVGQFVSADFNTRTLNAFINKPTLTSLVVPM